MATRSGKRHELVEAEILERAAGVFATRGFAAANLQDVADAMGISRTSLYYYIDSKEDLLVKLVEGVTFRIAHDLQEVAVMEVPARERLRHAIERIATLTIEQPARFRLLERAENELPANLADQHRAARRIVRDTIVGIVQDGVSDGSFDPCEPRVVAHAVLGMTNWIPWWINSATDLTSDVIVTTMTTLLVKGLSSDSGGEVSSGSDGVTRVLGAMKASITQLEGMLESEGNLPKAAVAGSRRAKANGTSRAAGAAAGRRAAKRDPA